MLNLESARVDTTWIIPRQPPRRKKRQSHSWNFLFLSTPHLYFSLAMKVSKNAVETPYKLLVTKANCSSMFRTMLNSSIPFCLTQKNSEVYSSGILTRDKRRNEVVGFSWLWVGPQIHSTRPRTRPGHPAERSAPGRCNEYQNGFQGRTLQSRHNLILIKNLI